MIIVREVTLWVAGMNNQVRLRMDGFLRGDRRWLALIGILLSVLACAAPPPQPTNSAQGGSDAQSGSPCEDSGKSSIGGSAGATAIERLCSFQRALIDDKRFYYQGPDQGSVEPYFPGDSEAPKSNTQNGQNMVRVVFYTGLKVNSKDPGAVADVLRLQTHFPSEYKSAGFTSDADVTFTPSGTDNVGFASTSYNYLKPPKDGDKKIDYDGRLQFISFAGAGVAVVDNMSKNNNSMLSEYKGLLLIIPEKDHVAVIGRTEQLLAAEQQSVEDVKGKLKTRVFAAIKRDFENYKRAADAKRIMDDKRAKTGAKK
jgi:hypothetical protein